MSQLYKYKNAEVCVMEKGVIILSTLNIYLICNLTLQKKKKKKPKTKCKDYIYLLLIFADINATEL